MKKIITNIKTAVVFAALAGGFLLGGCEKYLDQAPEASVKQEDAFKDFTSFQGFVEGCQNQVVDVVRTTDFSDYNLVDETRRAVTFVMGHNFDNGDYWGWQGGYGSYFGRTSAYNYVNIQNPLAPAAKSTWYGGWFGIRRANLGLANMDKLVNATQEEKDLIKGQLLFFRAYFYFTLMRDWGGLPYLDKALEPTEEMKYPRLNYVQTAMKADADFAEAAKLLPLDWDKIAAGQKTLGNNRQRINKIMALAFQAKNLLYAASPLMNKESTGSATYNVELCKKAADVFAQVINTCEQTSIYTLQPWATYNDIFYRVSPSKDLPGGTEVIFNAPFYSTESGRMRNDWGLPNCGYIAQSVGVCANYVNNWGMKNGLPISDPASGFNPADPWSNRDPRFYKTIVVDGDKICNATSAGADQFFQSSNGARHRSAANNITGFISNKYWGLTCNKFDNGWASQQYHFLCPILRLSDVYLLYAEAVLQGFGTPQSSASGSITAVAAVNKVRARAAVPDLDPKFTASKDDFMEQIVLERAVELSFEAHRWNDLRRWLKNGDPRYLNKTELLFDRDPVTKKPINIQERLMIQRVVSDKHNWLPFPVNTVTLYNEFKQNPGW
jgi:starch-binding outer membrane protein, SusD/RagB family